MKPRLSPYKKNKTKARKRPISRFVYGFSVTINAQIFFRGILRTFKNIFAEHPLQRGLELRFSSGFVHFPLFRPIQFHKNELTPEKNQTTKKSFWLRPCYSSGVRSESEDEEARTREVRT